MEIFRAKSADLRKDGRRTEKKTSEEKKRRHAITHGGMDSMQCGQSASRVAGS